MSEYPKFKKAVSKVPVDSVMQVPDEELKSQFRLFLERLQAMTTEMNIIELRKVDPKDLIKQFFLSFQRTL